MANPPASSNLTQYGHLQREASGAPAGWTYLNITGQATTAVKATPGILHTLTFNNPTATAVITLYDNTAGSGTKIGTITVPASPMPVTLTYDVTFLTALTIVTATASSDITVSYI